MKKILNNFLNNESGATAIEYVLIVGCIGLVIVTGAGMLGDTVNNAFNEVANKLTEITGSGDDTGS